MEDLALRAIREKWRFESKKGLLTAEEVCDLPLSGSKDGVDLNAIAVTIDEQITVKSTKNFVDDIKATDSLLTAKLEFVKHIIKLRKEENEKKEKAKAKRVELARLREIAVRKSDQALEGKSLEEIEKLIQTLEAE